MQNILNDIYSDKIQEELAVQQNQSYAKFLSKYDLKYTMVDNYFQIGEINWTQGWILDVSVIKAQLVDLLETIIPLLKRENVPFKVVINGSIAKAVLSGQLGYAHLGKLVSIYPKTEDQAVCLAENLINSTQKFKGPNILTDRHLGSVVYTRYGGCNPIIQISKSGSREEMIYNSVGELVQDKYTIPFIIPESIHWPFLKIAPLMRSQKQTPFLDRYKEISILKEDAKGNVIKALWLKKLYIVKWCIIKEGKKNMVSDSEGRDICDRLRWQYELHNHLQEYIRIPKIYEFFEEDGDSFLTMQYIKGTDLDDLVQSIFGKKTWLQLESSDKLKLLNYTDQVLDMITCMHLRGYIHRDITPLNFLVDKYEKLWMIDLELSYSNLSKRPSPPFRLGTTGFMSPEQMETKAPTIQQDIYALGGMLITLLTGILPYKFGIHNKQTLKRQLLFFMPDQNLVNVIADCFDSEPNSRPSILTLKNKIETFRNDTLKNIESKKTSFSSVVDPDTLASTIAQSLKGLSTPAMMTPDHLWFSKSEQQEGIKYYQADSNTISVGYYDGLSGILTLLARAYKAGFPIDSCMKGYEQSWIFICNECVQYLSEMSAGFYGGTAGIATALIEGLTSGLIQKDESILSDLKSYLLNKNVIGNGVVKGTAGQGIALLKATPLFQGSIIKSYLDERVIHLLQQQQIDGSWLTTSDNKVTNCKMTGWGHGVAGITCFLLNYSKIFHDENTKEASNRSLAWLIRQSRKRKNRLIWYLDTKNKQIEFGMQNGVAGVVLAFLKGYELTRNLQFRQIAEDVLRSIPSPWINRDLTLATGLVGIGELYLEAAKVFDSDEWRERAGWITNFLIHHFQQQKDNSLYWIQDNAPFFSPSFMTGNAGIIHFLIRYRHFEKITHPLLAI